MNWHKNFKGSVLLAMSLLLCSCALFSSERILSPEEQAIQNRQKIQRRYASKYDWAVQYFEAGQYEKAIESLKELRQDGAIVSAFQNIPYFLGMSYYRQGNIAAARNELESLSENKPDLLLLQEANITLLLLYEKSKEWTKLAALAAETNKSNLYQNNRILLKLLWGNALLEQNELQGSLLILSEALSLLNSQAPDDVLALEENSNQDLWGRYSYTMVKAKLLSCSALPDKSTSAWIDASGSCFLESEKEIIQTLLKSSWLSSGIRIFSASLVHYSEKLQNALSNTHLPLKQKQNLTAKARQIFYELLHQTEESNKAIKNQGDTHAQFNELQRQIDHLIYSLALPSSN